MKCKKDIFVSRSGSEMQVALSCVLLAASAMSGCFGLMGMKTAADSAAADAMKKKWLLLGPRWQDNFPIAVDQPHLGSWLDVKQQPWGVGCKICKETKVSGAWASYEIQTTDQLQKINIAKHHKCKKHLLATRQWLKEGGCSGPSPGSAPTTDEFENFLKGFEKTTSLSQKELQMAWCLAEGLKALDQRFIAKASQICLLRDERHGRLAIRFFAVAPDLTSRSGFLGQARQGGTGADNVSLATWDVMKRACYRFLLAPLGKTDGFFRKQLFEQLRRKVVAICADAAADEMASCEILRSERLTLSPDDEKPMLPNLQHVFRDRAHASRRLTSRPWNADAKLKEVMEYMGRGAGSMARLINDSQEIKRIFANHCASCDSVIRDALSSFRSAGLRFESHARPLGRTCLFFHACVKTALHLMKARTDLSAKKAREWLEWVSEEHLLQAAMLADAADSSLALTRSLDSENVDPAQLKSELLQYTKQIRSLFVEGRCVTVFGFTSTMLKQLNSPVIFYVGKHLRTLGSNAGVARDVMDRCLGRMQAWVKLAVSAMEAEFPHFEVAQAFEIFNLRGVSGSADAHLKTLAHTYKLDLARLKTQWEDLYPRAQMEYKEQTGLLKDSQSFKQGCNKEAWRIIVERYSVPRLRKVHPSDLLCVALQHYFCCTPSTSGIEQNFSLGQSKYTQQRKHAKAGNEELVLKLFYGLPHQTQLEKQEICKLARVAWAAQYGCPRQRSDDAVRSDKGLKRTTVDAGMTETLFVKRRREAAAAAVSSYSGVLETEDPNFFTDGHQKEMEFLQKKTQSQSSGGL